MTREIIIVRGWDADNAWAVVETNADQTERFVVSAHRASWQACKAAWDHARATGAYYQGGQVIPIRERKETLF